MTELKQIQWRFDAKKVDDAYLQNKKAEMLNEVENRLKELDQKQLQTLIKKLNKDLTMPNIQTKASLVKTIKNKLNEDKVFNQMMSVQ